MAVAIMRERMGTCIPSMFFICDRGASLAVWLQFVAMHVVSHGPVGLVGGTVGGRRW